MPEQLVRTVFDWDHFLVYLAGPIDAAHDGGKGWRIEWSEKLLELGFRNNQILNPNKKPLSGTIFDLDNESEIIRQHRHNKDWEQYEDVVSQIAHIDLRLVDKSDLVLANFPKISRDSFNDATDSFAQLMRDLVDASKLRRNNYFMQIVQSIEELFYEMIEESANQRVPTWGTVHEIVVARQQKKPVMIVWEGGKESCSGWLLWLVGHENVFSSFDELFCHLESVSKGEAAIDVRDWLLLDLDKHK